jgi:hypothetical protein
LTAQGGIRRDPGSYCRRVCKSCILDLLLHAERENSLDKYIH